jgi:hypothetical protein
MKLRAKWIGNYSERQIQLGVVVCSVPDVGPIVCATCALIVTLISCAIQRQGGANLNLVLIRNFLKEKFVLMEVDFVAADVRLTKIASMILIVNPPYHVLMDLVH